MRLHVRLGAKGGHGGPVLLEERGVHVGGGFGGASVVRNGVAVNRAKRLAGLGRGTSKSEAPRSRRKGQQQTLIKKGSWFGGNTMPTIGIVKLS